MPDDTKPPSHEDTLGALHGADPKEAQKYADSGATGAASSSAAEDLDALNMTDLHDRARDLGMTGTSGMNKDELVRAIRKEQKKQAP